MTTLKITPTDDGPYMVEGDVRIVDPLGNEYDLGGEAAVFLCRCGNSATKPFCDGTHERVRFEAAGRTPATASPPRQSPELDESRPGT